MTARPKLPTLEKQKRLVSSPPSSRALAIGDTPALLHGLLWRLRLDFAPGWLKRGLARGGFGTAFVSTLASQRSKLEVIHPKKKTKPRIVAVFHRAHGAGAAPSRLPGYKLQTALQHKLQIIDNRRAQQLHQAVRLTAACLHYTLKTASWH